MKNPSITPERISEGQKQSGIQLVVDAVRKAMGVAIDELSDNGVINTANFQRMMGKGNKVVSAVTATAKAKFAELAENITGCLRLISGAETLTLEPTDGTETIAKAKDVFTGYIDSDFKNWGCDMKSAPTEAMNVSVHELVKDGNFRAIFGGLSDDIEKLILTQTQIIQFVKNHRKWLRADGWGTFFLFKVEGKLFVAGVGVGGGGSLEVYVRHFSRDGVWDAEVWPRIVVPQQILAN